MVKENKNKSNKSIIWREIATALIGLSIHIVQSSSSDLEGIRGIIVDESHNILKIQTENKIISVSKENQVFEIITKNNEVVIVEGYLLKGSPDQRVKRKIPIW